MAKKAIKPIRTEAEYEAALDEIESYFDDEPRPGTPDGDRFDLLALVVEDYERKRWPIEPPAPVEAIRYRMHTGGFTQTDLGRLLRSRQRASDILSGRRPLSMDMAWVLHREWGIPADALIRPHVPDPPIKRRISSSAIAEFHYQAKQRRLSVTFITGRTYVYEDVPAEVYQRFSEASSKGTFFNKTIRDRYGFREVEAA